MTDHAPSRAKRRGVALPVLVAGAASSLLLAFSMTPTFAALTAAITNNGNTAGTGTLTMQEANSDGSVLCNSTDGGGVSTNSATCSTINKYGGQLGMVPGTAGTVTTNVTIKNTGTVAATSFSLAGGACTQSNNGSVNGSATDLCAKMNLVVKSGSTTVYTGTAAGFASQNLNLVTLLGGPVAAGATVPFSFAVTLDNSAGNTYQGLKVSQPMTWTFGA